jgi:hypothetical protein
VASLFSYALIPTIALQPTVIKASGPDAMVNALNLLDALT